MTHTPFFTNQNQFFGLSYVDSCRQDFKHLQTDPIHRGPPRSSPLTAIPSKYVAQPSRRSMVTRRPTSIANPRSAGHVTSPQNIARTTPPPARPVSARGSHGSNSRSASSVVDSMCYSPEPSDESEDSYSDCCSCSEDEHETDFSSRATSPDDEFDTGQDELARRKRQIVDASMLLFRMVVYKWFAQVCGVVTHDGGDGGRGTKRSADEISGRQSSSQLPRGGGKKRQLRNEDGGGVGGEEEDSDHEGGGGSKKAKRDAPKFACPYYKHDPEKYRAHKTCLGPGWDSAHRVKEHLWRRHMLPQYICHDCNTVFKDNEKLFYHIRTANDCSRDKKSAIDGINPATAKLLKARQRGHMSEEDKWVRMYKILFPDDDVVPTPYYHDEPEAKPQVVSADELRVARYIKNEIFPEARRKLEREADRELDGVSERLISKAFDMVQNAVYSAMQELGYSSQQHQQQGPHLLSLPPSPRPDSGVATPEPSPPQAYAAGIHDFSGFFPEQNYTYGQCDFRAFPGGEEFLQGMPFLGSRSGYDGFSPAGNQDPAYGAGRDELPFELAYDLPALGFS